MFLQIREGSTSGGQDWSSLAGSVLCSMCYQRFKTQGTLERAKNKPLAVSARRCTYYARCERPEESRDFYQISEGSTSGGQDWSSLAGSVLCDTCYLRFKRSGTLEKSYNKQLAASARRCTYASCKRPEESCNFYQISEGSTSGGQDWSSLAGSVLCDTGYSRFKRSGTLERSVNKPLAASERRCTFASCQRPEESSKFVQIGESMTSGGQDWSSLAGSVLCKSSYERFRQSSTLERRQRPLSHSKAARDNLKPLGQVAAECVGRSGKRKAACWDDEMRGEEGSSTSGGECREGGGSKGKRRVVGNDEQDEQEESRKWLHWCASMKEVWGDAVAQLWCEDKRPAP
jgi:hypothetical protein